MSFSHPMRHDFPQDTPPAGLTALRDRIRRIEAPAKHGVLPFDVPAIDRALPGGGLALGAVHEILGVGADEEDAAATCGFVAGILARLSPHLANAFAPEAASASRVLRDAPPEEPPRGGVSKGRTLLSMTDVVHGIDKGRHPEEAAKRPSRRTHCADPTDRWLSQSSRRTGSGPVLWCLKRPDLYGPGLLEHGLDPSRLVLVLANRDDELLWAIEEGLRTPDLAAVVGEIGRLPMVAGRRLQLAAERSGVTAFLLRRWRNAEEAAAERERPSAALTRWRVAALPSREISGQPGIGKLRWRVELLRCRAGAPSRWVMESGDVEVADATGHVSLSAALADRPVAPPRREPGRNAAVEPLRRAG